MSKKQEFINYVKEMQEKCPTVEMNEEARIYWDALIADDTTKEKPMFTDNGKLVLRFLQNNLEPTSWKSRDIAEELFISPRTVSGAMRKLVTDGFVEKIGDSPICYMLTEKGKNIIIND